MNTLRTRKHSSLGNQTLDDLHKVPLNDFNLETAISLWWDDKIRSSNQSARNKFEKQSSTQMAGTGTVEEEGQRALLEVWEKWMSLD